MKSTDLFPVEIGKTEIKMNKPLSLGQTMLDLSITLMHEFKIYYVQSKYGRKTKLCYMDTNNFVYETETEGF